MMNSERQLLSFDLVNIIRTRVTSLAAFHIEHLSMLSAGGKPLTYFKFLQAMNGEHRPSDEILVIEAVCIRLGWWSTEAKRALSEHADEALRGRLGYLLFSIEEVLRLPNYEHLKRLDEQAKMVKLLMGTK
jgi:hypothetical protein